MNEFSSSSPLPAASNLAARDYDPQDPPRFGEWVRVLGVTPAAPRDDSPTVPGNYRDNNGNASPLQAHLALPQSHAPGNISERPTDPSTTSGHSVSSSVNGASSETPTFLEKNKAQFHVDELSDVSWKPLVSEKPREIAAPNYPIQDADADDKHQKTFTRGQEERNKQREKQRNLLLGVIALIVIVALIAAIWAWQRPVKETETIKAAPAPSVIAPKKAIEKAAESVSKTPREAQPGTPRHNAVILQPTQQPTLQPTKSAPAKTSSATMPPPSHPN